MKREASRTGHTYSTLTYSWQLPDVFPCWRPPCLIFALTYCGYPCFGSGSFRPQRHVGSALNIALFVLALLCFRRPFQCLFDLLTSTMIQIHQIYRYLPGRSVVRSTGPLSKIKQWPTSREYTEKISSPLRIPSLDVVALVTQIDQIYGYLLLRSIIPCRGSNNGKLTEKMSSCLRVEVSILLNSLCDLGVGLRNLVEYYVCIIDSC